MGDVIRDALLNPDRFFAERTPRPSLGTAATVVLVVALVSTAAVGFIGWTLSQEITATAQVDNPNRPPDWACEDGGFGSDTTNFSSGCDQPRTKTIDMGDKLWEAFSGQLPMIFFASFFGWLLVAAGLHAASGLAGGRGSFSGTLTVAAWGTLPTLFQTAVGGASMYFAIQGMELGGSPEVLAQQFQSMASRTQSGNLAVSAFVTLWQAYVWTYGLKHVRNLETGSAAGAAGVVAFVSFVLTAI